MNKNPVSRIQQENWNIPDLEKIMNLLEEKISEKKVINQ